MLWRKLLLLLVSLNLSILETRGMRIAGSCMGDYGAGAAVLFLDCSLFPNLTERYCVVEGLPSPVLHGVLSRASHVGCV